MDDDENNDSKITISHTANNENLGFAPQSPPPPPPPPQSATPFNRLGLGQIGQAVEALQKKKRKESPPGSPIPIVTRPTDDDFEVLANPARKLDPSQVREQKFPSSKKRRRYEDEEDENENAEDEGQEDGEDGEEDESGEENGGNDDDEEDENGDEEVLNAVEEPDLERGEEEDDKRHTLPDRKRQKLDNDQQQQKDEIGKVNSKANNSTKTKLEMMREHAAELAKTVVRLQNMKTRHSLEYDVPKDISLEDAILMEEKYKYLTRSKNMVKLYRNALGFAVYMIELFCIRFPRITGMSHVKGFQEAVFLTINETYDHYLYECYDLYGDKMTINPLYGIAMTLVGQLVQFNMMKAALAAMSASSPTQQNMMDGVKLNTSTNFNIENLQPVYQNVSPPIPNSSNVPEHEKEPIVTLNPDGTIQDPHIVTAIPLQNNSDVNAALAAENGNNRAGSGGGGYSAQDILNGINQGKLDHDVRQKNLLKQQQLIVQQQLQDQTNNQLTGVPVDAPINSYRNRFKRKQ